MIKSLLDPGSENDPDQISSDAPSRRAEGQGANVLGIFGNEESGTEAPKRTVSGPFDISGIDLPFPVTQQNPAPADAPNRPQPEPPKFLTLPVAEPEEPKDQPEEVKAPVVQVPYTPPTNEEAVRMTGLAFSAGIVLAGPIVFMLIFGWFADLLIGSSPWGLVGGVVLGSIIGFVQIIRLNTQILRTQKHSPPVSLLELDRSEAAQGEDPAASSNDAGKSLGLN